VDACSAMGRGYRDPMETVPGQHPADDSDAGGLIEASRTVDPGAIHLGHSSDGTGAESGHRHRDVQGGVARASVFGASDGLVSNISLILGVAGANPGSSVVRLAGVAGLIAGAVSMAAGEYVSMRAQRELFERELELERLELARNPEVEKAELVQVYMRRGLKESTAVEVAEQMMASPEQALEVHAREELGVAPDALGSPLGAATGSFLAFCTGAIIPLFPWFFADGVTAILWSVVLGVVAAAGLGAALAAFTGRPVWYTAGRQVLVAVVASSVTFGIGNLLGVQID
jgi:vacuolar iron transporter family protein